MHTVSRHITRCLCLLPVLAAVLLSGARCATEPRQQWTSIFNGRDLDGWTVKFSGHDMGVNYKNTFRVEDGILKVSYDQYDTFDDTFGHIFHDSVYDNYAVRVEYRFTGNQVAGGPEWGFRNNGIMIHSQSPESMGLTQHFPVSVEAQMLGGNGVDERTTGNVCTPGTHIVMNGELVTRHCTGSRSKTFHGDQWVTMEVQVYGDSLIRHIVNGDTVITYENPQLDPADPDARKRLDEGAPVFLKRGYIALQAESHPTEFRTVEIRRF
ncbi:DUF1080 domain-containing protein [bacterium]|nr:DUF1080 domain-containing protein [bacterium]